MEAVGESGGLEPRTKIVHGGQCGRPISILEKGRREQIY